MVSESAGELFGGWLWYGEGDEGYFLDDVEACAAEELLDDDVGEAGSVELDADGSGGFIERDTADAVDLAEAGDGHDGGFGRRNSVAEEDVQLGHGLMIAAERAGSRW